MLCRDQRSRPMEESLVSISLCAGMRRGGYRQHTIPFDDRCKRATKEEETTQQQRLASRLTLPCRSGIQACSNPFHVSRSHLLSWVLTWSASLSALAVSRIRSYSLSMADLHSQRRLVCCRTERSLPWRSRSVKPSTGLGVADC